ncbi:TPA: hypothetical protein ACGOTU_000044 [Streptococcus suis]
MYNLSEGFVVDELMMLFIEGKTVPLCPMEKIMTTRQTGGLNKGYKPTSPASA